MTPVYIQRSVAEALGRNQANASFGVQHRLLHSLSGQGDCERKTKHAGHAYIGRISLLHGPLALQQVGQ